MQAVAVNTAVFLMSFACAFLLAGQRPILTWSTRALLALVIVLFAIYNVLPAQSDRTIVAAATMIANGLFLAFGVIDFVRYRSSER